MSDEAALRRRENIYGLRTQNDEPVTKILRIKIVGASGLARRDIFGLSDPYVKLILQTTTNRTIIDSAKTRVIPRTLNPQWNEEFLFRLNPEKHRLVIEVYDNNRVMKDNFLGQIVVKLTSSIPTEVSPNDPLESIQGASRTLHLQKKAVYHRVKGSLSFFVTYLNPSQSDSLDNSHQPPANLIGENAEAGGLQVMSCNEMESSDVSGNDAGTLDSEEPLPNGWEERRDATGRVYYVDHATRTTSWTMPTILNFSQKGSVGNRPTASSTSPVFSTVEHHRSSRVVANCGGPPLPEGWDVAYTERGRMFFINHNLRTTTWIDPRTGRPSPSTSSVQSSSSSLANGGHRRISAINNGGINEHSGNQDPLPPGWEMRIHTDGRAFYIDHNSRKTQWEDPRLEKFAGPAVPYSRDFTVKTDSFRRNLQRPKSYVGGQVELHIERCAILESSFRSVMPFRDPEYLKARLWVIFDGEKGLDYGGVAREWFHLLAKEIFNPCYGLFIYSAMDNYTLQINPFSGFVNDEHLRYFIFVGRIVGMAIYHNKLLDAFFVPPFYKMMLERPVTLSDLESVGQ
ncbi:hypothetical protein ACOME3_003612 [Neoechinorhynchus agilis]